MTDKDNYTMIYFPDRLLSMRKRVKSLLAGTGVLQPDGTRDMGIDSNYSRIICKLLPSIEECVNRIYEEGNTDRHYEWEVKITKKGKINVDKEVERQEDKEIS